MSNLGCPKRAGRLAYRRPGVAALCVGGGQYGCG